MVAAAAVAVKTTDKVRAIVTALIIGLLPLSSIQATSVAQSVINDLSTSKVHQIEIFGIPGVVMPNAAIEADRLPIEADVRFTIDAARPSWKVRSLTYFLGKAGPTKEKEADFDCRWGCILRGSDSREIHAIYLDVGGTSGSINGFACDFNNGLNYWFRLLAFEHRSGLNLSYVIFAVVLVAASGVALLFWRRRTKKIPD